MRPCIVFDADGMLILGERFSDRYCKERGIPPSSMAGFFAGPFQECVVGKRDLKEAVAPHLAQWRWEGSADEFVRHWIEGEDLPDSALLDFARALRARGIPLALATNNERYRTAHLAHAFGHLFDPIVSSARAGHKKPSKEFFDELSRIVQEKVPGATLMFWDDDPENVEGARRAGLEAHQYVTLEGFTQEVERFLDRE